MKLKYVLLLIASTSLLLLSCNQESSNDENIEFYSSSKPCTRWWWFATEIKKEDIKHQLDWAKKNNFGGVEIAWVYPLYRYDKMYAIAYDRQYPKDSSAQKWLSTEWSEVVTYTKLYADSIGLSCDYTFGSAWPVAGLNIDKEHSTQIYGDTSFRQWLTFAWSYPENMLVVNHLDKEAFELFAKPIGAALEGALQGSKSAFFTDSWEIKLNGTNKIWTPGFDSTFKERFGYDIIPYMDDSLDLFPDVRYDYMMHLDEYVTNGFYKPYVAKCKELGAWSRVQCLAAPTDVMTTYSLVDIPETECMLNNPNYSRIVSSSAALSSKKLVSSETYTCLYGFPGTMIEKEQTADLKMVADAMFAQGVNKHFYHGTPYNPKGSDTVTFFATTYFAPGGNLEPELPEFNAYMDKVSGLMQKGRTYTDIAMYIPYEDGVMKGPYPRERQRVWVWGEYEMRYIFPPKEIEGYHPLWINRHFLEKAKFRNGILSVGDAEFSTLYVDVKYMDIKALKRILQLAEEGLPICIKQNPKEPGKIKSGEFKTLLNQLLFVENVSSNLQSVVKHPPLLQSDSLPEYWSRVDSDGSTLIFLAQWPSKNLAYPIYNGQSYVKESINSKFIINVNDREHNLNIEFKPYQSVMLKISEQGDVEYVDIDYYPKVPKIYPRIPQRTYF
ncbi:glycosyl hydrolase [Bacteroidia bacterium]|nr:glycosyl hydrolase [Bacteroidia bacterium]